MNDALVELLREIGYNLKKNNDYYSASAVFRSGDNPTALAIYPSKNLVCDFVEGTKTSIQGLIQKTLRLDNEQLTLFLKNKNLTNFTQPIKELPAIKITKVFNKNILNNLFPVHDYWLNRGITLETIKEFGGGICYENLPGFLMKDRYCFPIWNSKKELRGFTGRDTSGLRKSKYKNLGQVAEWVFPGHLNNKHIQEKKQIILVESPGCVLKLFDCGIRNVLCLSGLQCGLGLLNYMLRTEPKKIIIATNNEESKRGNDAALKLQNKLLRYFDSRTIKIHLPPAKDFCEIKDNDLIKQWFLSI